MIPSVSYTNAGSDSKSWWRWRWDQNSFHYSAFTFFLAAFCFYASVAMFYAWLILNPYTGSNLSTLGCREDGEGSWSVGVFYGDSPFSLKPIEALNVWKDDSAAWPVANPVLSCALVSDAGFPSNFVADPFLYVQGEIFYLFYETKNPITLQGDIGVSKSSDKGATWVPLGVALDEDWHLSFPYVFSYNDQIYMMPESSENGDLRVYRADNFPLKWRLEKIILKKPLVDSVLLNYNGVYWLLGSDHSGFGAKNNGHLEIWYSSSPFGPWRSHKRNPIYNTDKRYGARNGGRPFMYNGDFYRLGQDSGETYGRRIKVFKVEVLSQTEFKEVEVPLGFEESRKGRNAWNGVRHHHLDVQQLRSGDWVAVMDGDRVPSGDPVRRFILGCASFLVAIILIVLFGVVVGAVKCIVPLYWCAYDPGKRSDALFAWEQSNLLSAKVKRFCGRVNRTTSLIRNWIKPNTCLGWMALVVIFIVGVWLVCAGVSYIYGGSGAQKPYQWKERYSQFTLLTMTYDARLWNLKMYVKHYSRCASVKEIVVVWNKGVPPESADFDSAVPVRIRIEEKNSLNNRFKADPLIMTKAVLELDDDIMMTCDDVERGFRVWREHPDRIVGFYPRLIVGSPLEYRAEKFARAHKGYNIILTGAAFLDTTVAFERYWSDEAKPGREIVDSYFNCEDVLMNFLYANASSVQTVEYVRPSWAIDTSKFSGVAISGNTNVHYGIRSKCLRKFSEMYGSLSSRKWNFEGREDRWDV